jgi:hypothetical protein
MSRARRSSPTPVQPQARDRSNDLEYRQVEGFDIEIMPNPSLDDTQVRAGAKVRHRTPLLGYKPVFSLRQIAILEPSVTIAGPKT